MHGSPRGGKKPITEKDGETISGPGPPRLETHSRGAEPRKVASDHGSISRGRARTHGAPHVEKGKRKQERTLSLSAHDMQTIG